MTPSLPEFEKGYKISLKYSREDDEKPEGQEYLQTVYRIVLPPL